jgi:hypothetical protein
VKRKQPKVDDHLRGAGLVPIKKVPRVKRWRYRRTLYAAARAAADCGEVWRVNSSFRSYKEQLALWKLYLSGRGNLAARPGTSRHEKGNALDLSGPDGSPIGTNAKRRAALIRQGFRFAVPSESWHVEHN